MNYNGNYVDKKEKERDICNKNLQSIIALVFSIIIILALIIGVNFKLVNEGSVATISQLRDLVSGSIGFLLGNQPKQDKN